ncbi:MAG: LysM peptidoglycan-binding domain-containing protein [Chlamydiia bacterium]|nr:LysM peptidoglycan-binding domain-containing protein [Chlamydiia bacterium]
MMDRKKTIWIAVLINAGLLVVLFIAALTTEEETAVPMAELQKVQEEAPLFKEIDLSVRPPLQAQMEIPTIETLAEMPAMAALPPLVLPAAPVETPPAILQPSPAASKYREVAVKKGDSLDKIAKANQTTIDELIQCNHLSSTFLKVGQVLKVPTGKTVASATPARQLPSKPAATAADNSAEYYTVKVGDNPWTIAMKHHMKVDELLKLNGLSDEKARKLKPGDRLRIKHP